MSEADESIMIELLGESILLVAELVVANVGAVENSVLDDK